ncbi:MAG: sugar transferase [Chitinophagaceae bacterium]|nr:sugar transferase [Chitinophagaceae bacterium]
MSNLSPLAKQKHAIIALINCDEVVTSMLSHCQLGNRTQIAFKNGIELMERWEANEWTICAVVSQSEVMAPSGVSLLETLVNKKNITIPFIIICQNINSKILQIALQAGVAEVFKIPFKIEKFETRFNFIVENWEVLRRKPDATETARRSYKTPVLKRSFDILFSLIFLVLLSPLLVLVSILIAFESRGPIFYYSLRVGRGYHIFKFYKFRSMYFDADTRLKDLKHLNQYTTSKKKQKVEEDEDEISYQFLCDECKIAATRCQYPVYADGVHMCEKQYAEILKHSRESTFIKIKNDPRMTRVGAFIRRTSIDEIPQLWNVLIGDMSIVGNRPLPLYEAEKLTTDKYALRFMAPAGITGLWQVEKRGSGKMSENDRLILDNIYAKNNSFFNDIILILRTIPAVFQKENV